MRQKSPSCASRQYNEDLLLLIWRSTVARNIPCNTKHYRVTKVYTVRKLDEILRREAINRSK